jgi:hypothetical protein
MSGSQSPGAGSPRTVSIKKAGENMKAFVKLGVLLLSLLFLLTACDLFNQVNIGWRIDSYSAVVANNVTVSYTVWNDGQYDLDGVNLKVGVWMNLPGEYVSDWTMPDFSLGKGETKSGSIVIYVGGDTGPSGAAVLAVDMDNPKD